VSNNFHSFTWPDDLVRRWLPYLEAANREAGRRGWELTPVHEYFYDVYLNGLLEHVFYPPTEICGFSQADRSGLGWDVIKAEWPALTAFERRAVYQSFGDRKWPDPRFPYGNRQIPAFQAAMPGEPKPKMPTLEMGREYLREPNKVRILLRRT